MQRSRAVVLGITCRCMAWNEDLSTSFAAAGPHVTNPDTSFCVLLRRSRCHELKGCLLFQEQAAAPRSPMTGEHGLFGSGSRATIIRLSFWDCSDHDG